MKQTFKFIVKFTAWLLLILVASILAILFYLTTPSGKLTLRDQLNDRVRLDGIRFEIGEIIDYMPLHVKIISVDLLDDAGDRYLSIDDFSVAASIIDPFGQPTVACSGQVKRIRVNALPDDQNAADDPEIPFEKQLESISLPVDFVLRLDVSQLILADKVAGQEIKLESRDARASFQKSSSTFALDLPLMTKSFGDFLTAQLYAVGPLTNLKTALQVQTQTFIYQNQKLENLSLKALGSNIILKPELRLRTAFRYQGVDGFLNLPYLRRDGNEVTLRGLELKGLKTEAQADLIINTSALRAQGKTRINTSDLSAVGTFINLPIAGSLKLNADLDISADLEGSASFALIGQNMAYDQYKIQDINAKGDLAGDLENPSLHLDIIAKALNLGGIKLDQVTAISKVEGGKGPLAVDLRGPLVKAQFDSEIDVNPDVQEITFNTLSLLYDRQRLDADTQFTISRRDDLISLTPVTFKYLGFPIQAAGELRGNVVDVRIQAEADLGILSRLYLATGDVIDGIIRADVNVKGPFDKLGYFGRVKLSGGGYQNPDFNAILQDIELDLKLDNQRVLLEKLRATDGAEGVLNLNGVFDIAAFSMDLKATASNLRAANLDDLAATIEDASLTASGPLGDLKVAGNVTIGKVNFDITKQFLSDVETLNVVNLDTALVRQDLKEKSQDPVVNGSLNIAVTIPEVVNTFGRGLDALWRGNLRVQGKISDPIILGAIELVRGKMAILGQSLVFKRGRIAFDGDVVNRPFLDILANTTVDDYEIGVTIEGRSNNPDFKLTSDPFLPEDEIMSYILFGGSSTQLSPLQALKLAKAVNDLNSGGRGILGATSNALGLDDLSVSGGDGDEGATLGVGKTFGDKVHVHFDQGLKAEDSKVAVDVDITKRLTVTSEVGTSASSESVGLKYKYDY